MIALQWGSTIGYDILVFDKAGHRVLKSRRRPLIRDAGSSRRSTPPASGPHTGGPPLCLLRRFGGH
jgi:3-deoxy-D-manno-octulosonic acid (KDO) 8-phosphate synthase